MSSEVRIQGPATGNTCYFEISNPSTGLSLSRVAFTYGTPGPGNSANFAWPATERAGNLAIWFGTMPANISAGLYRIDQWEAANNSGNVAGANMANDFWIGYDERHWDGSKWVYLGNLSGGGGNCPTAAEIADAVLEEPFSEHGNSGTVGEAFITIANTLDTTISSRLGAAAAPGNFSAMRIDAAGNVTANTAGGGGNGGNLTAAGVWSYANRTLTSASNITSTGANVTLDGAGNVSAANCTLTAAERSAIANATLDLGNAVESNMTVRQALRLLTTAEGGKLSGGNTTTITIRNAVADSKTRITATVDEGGNRTAVSYDLT